MSRSYINNNKNFFSVNNDNNVNNTTNKNLLRVASINTNNAKSNMIYLSKLASVNECVYINEHWLLKDEREILESLSNDHALYFESDMTCKPQKGRCYGGQAWLINKKIKIKEIDFINEYMSVVTFDNDLYQICIIGVHLPYNNNTKINKFLYESNLQLIKRMISLNNNKSIATYIIGDFNADLQRSNQIDKSLIKFIKDERLVSLHDFSVNKLNLFTYQNGTTKSCIDHILVSEDVNSNNCLIDQDILNMSDHKAISLSISTERKIINKISDDKNIKIIKTLPDLTNSEIKDEYHRLLDKNIDILMNEIDQVNEPNKQELDNIYNKFCNKVKTAYNDLSKETKINIRKKSLIWWTPEIKSIKNSIMELRKTIKSNIDINEDRTNRLKILKKRFRQNQRQQLYLHKQNDYNRLNFIADKPSKNEFWKRFNKRKLQSNFSTLDEDLKSNYGTIREHYISYFNQTKDNISENHRDISLKTKEYEASINTNHYEDDMFQEIDIKSAIKQTKTSKTKGFDGLNNDMLKYGNTNQIVKFITSLFNKMSNLNHIPLNFNTSIVMPIIKDKSKQNKFDLENMRPISISNALSQLFERVLINRMPCIKMMNSNQFGFKKGSSCAHAIFTVKETINHYISNGSPCYLISLDAAKAFDRVWRDGLLYKLINKIDSYTWRIFKSYYDSSQGIIKKDELNVADTFRIECGVKQGGVMSPLLYNFYINDLLEECLKSKLGARINNINVCIISYCDDIIIMSPSFIQAQKLLNICNEYANSWKIVFNANKSKLLKFNELIRNKNDFVINKTSIPEVEEIKYLGVQINNKLDFKAFYNNKFHCIRKSIYALYSFGLKKNGLNPKLKSFVYKSYCRPKGIYGFEAITLTKTFLKHLDTIQNSFIRHIIGLKKRSKIRALLKAIKMDTIEHLYIKHKSMFIKNIKKIDITSSVLKEIIKTNKGMYSFINDLVNMDKLLGINNIENLIKDDKMRIKKINEHFECDSDGYIDSIKMCLYNYKSSYYTKLLELLLENNFNNEDALNNVDVIT